MRTPHPASDSSPARQAREKHPARAVHGSIVVKEPRLEAGNRYHARPWVRGKPVVDGVDEPAASGTGA